VGRNEEKKHREKVEKKRSKDCLTKHFEEKVVTKRRLILLSYYPQTEKQGTFEKEIIIFEECS